MECTHHNFIADAEVARIPDGPSGLEFMISIKVKCSDCGKPFEWKGLPAGIPRNNPTVSLNRLELRAPIIPHVPAKPTFTEHIAGTLSDGLQCCILCGTVITDLTNVMIGPGSSRPQGFAPGAVWMSSGNPRITTTVDPREEGCNVTHCTDNQ